MTTYKQKVAAFWEWFSKHADRFYQTIEDGKCPDLVGEFQAVCGEHLPKFAWVFGPGADNIGHSFTLSGEGDLNLQFLASYWAEQAPTLKGWTFYSSRQPGEVNTDIEIKIGELKFRAGDLLVEPELDMEDESIGLAFWHPHFPECDENLQYTVFGIWTDEALGEMDAQSWITSASVRDISKSTTAMPVTKLKAYVDYLQAEHGWEKSPPDETYTLYQLPEPSDKFPRADTISGTTCNMALIGEYLKSEGQMEEILEGTGAMFIYIGINRECFPEGEEVTFRGELEDKLDAALRAEKSGRVFGGAFGMMSGYVDLVIYDGPNSVELIKQVLDGAGLKDNYFVRPFGNPQPA